MDNPCGCSPGCANKLQGQSLPLPSTTVSPGHPTDGSPYTVKGLGSADLDLSGRDIRNRSTNGGSDAYAGKGSF